MSDITDINKFRSDREKPDSQFVRRDDYGREMFLFGLQYEMGGSLWANDVWAYDAEDAQNRVNAMRRSLTVLGQTYTVIPS